MFFANSGKPILINLMVLLFIFLSLSATALGQPKNSFSCAGKAEAASRGKSVGDIRKVIDDAIKAVRRKEEAGDKIEAEDWCVIAELMKRVGDYRAPEYYKKAAAAADNEPGYRFLLAEYWRNFRGAQHSVFPRAEENYFQALQKIKQAGGNHQTTAARIERGLVALYQEDGIPLLHYNSGFVERPYLFFATVFNAAKNSSDFDRRSEVRDFTSESLLSRQRLNRDLTEGESKGIIRVKDEFESFNRLRFRYKGGPVVDFTYKYRELNQAQITNFFEPNEFNDASLSEYGVAVEKPFGLRAFDLFLRGSYKRARRVGAIEFLPRAKEYINQVEANAVVSRFVGPDKANFEFTYVFQDIQEDRLNPLKRDRSIYAGKFTYQLFRPVLERVYGSRFETRGVDLFGGVLHDNETFGIADVNRNDYFIGSSLKGFKGFDFTVQPTVFTAEVGGDTSQKNSQLRTSATVLYRIFDEEKQPGNLAFLHLVIPFARDVAIKGPGTYENYRIGVGLNAKFFVRGERPTTWLASFRYDYQDFLRLRKTVHLYSVNVSMGF
jgi:hypothetical protein